MHVNCVLRCCFFFPFVFVCLRLCMGFIVKTIHVILDPNAIHVLFITTMLACVCVFFSWSIIRYSGSLFIDSIYFISIFFMCFFGFCNMNRINIHFIVYLANGTSCNIHCMYSTNFPYLLTYFIDTTQKTRSNKQRIVYGVFIWKRVNELQSNCRSLFNYHSYFLPFPSSVFFLSYYLIKIFNSTKSVVCFFVYTNYSIEVAYWLVSSYCAKIGWIFFLVVIPNDL